MIRFPAWPFGSKMPETRAEDRGVSGVSGQPFRVAFPLVGRRGPSEDIEAARPGGADISTLELAKELKARGHAPVIVVHNMGPTVTYVESLGLTVAVLNHPCLVKRAEITEETIAGLRLAIPRVEEVLREHDIDIVHTNDAALHRTWGFFNEWIGFRHLWHDRGLFSHPDVSQPHLRRASKILTISQFVRTKAPEDLKARIEVVDNPIRITAGLEKEVDRKWLREELGLAQGDIVFVMVANANPRKRWSMYLEAAAIAAQARPDLHFCMVGTNKTSEIKQVLKERWPRGHRHQLHEMGYRYDVPRIMSGADVVVATARKEPLGRTVIEGVLAGTAVLAASSGAFKELFRKNAAICLVEPDTAEEFARRFIEIERTIRLHAPIAGRLAGEFGKRFAPARHALSIESVYRKMLAAQNVNEPDKINNAQPSFMALLPANRE